MTNRAAAQTEGCRLDVFQMDVGRITENDREKDIVDPGEIWRARDRIRRRRQTKPVSRAEQELQFFFFIEILFESFEWTD